MAKPKKDFIQRAKKKRHSENFSVKRPLQLLSLLTKIIVRVASSGIASLSLPEATLLIWDEVQRKQDFNAVSQTLQDIHQNQRLFGSLAVVLLCHNHQQMAGSNFPSYSWLLTIVSN